MVLICPNCGSDSCVAPADQVIKAAPTFYTKCERCNELILDKINKINLTNIHFENLQCTNCGKRPLDAVMAHVLSLCVEDESTPDTALRELGTPLLSPGIPTFGPPHLGFQSLVLLTDKHIVAEASSYILEEVPEVKAILFGEKKRVIGLKSVQDRPYTCRVTGGCDLRADLTSSAYGQLLIYKSQSTIHIEHDNTGKIRKLSSVPLAGKIVLDALAGPGTLGLVSVLMGAQKVILNDAWLPAVKNSYLNLQVNKEVIGIKTIKRNASYKFGSWKGDNTQLFCTAATNDSTIELYHGTFESLRNQNLAVDVVLVDPFPGTVPLFESTVKKFRDEYRNVRVYYI